MSKYFNFYDPLEKRYIFNNFLIVAALVEALILIFTLIWQIDEGVLGGPVKVVPFPWKEYLLASFTAPIALMFLFGLIVQGFDLICRETPEASDRQAQGGKWRRARYLLGLLALLGLLVFLFMGRSTLGLITWGIKSLGLAGAYVLVGLMALGLLYLPLRLLLRYRLQKKAMEYQYLLTLAERHGVVMDPQRLAPLAPPPGEEKNLPDSSRPRLNSPESGEDPPSH